MRQKISLLDLSFYGDGSSSQKCPSKFIEWDRNTKELSDYVVFTDLCLDYVKHPHFKHKKKIGWLIESIAISPNIYKKILGLEEHFEIILTHNDSLISRNGSIKQDKYVFAPFGGTWIDKEDWVKPTKTKLVSIIASEKNWTDGHKFRHEIIGLNIPKLDIFGRRYNPIDKKIDGLRDYRFSLSIENCVEDTYFTEKLIDCFATYTVPVYYGTEKIKDIFDPKGIIFIEDRDKAKTIIEGLSVDQYNEMLPAIENNFHTAKDYACCEDYFYNNFLYKYMNE